MDYKIKLIIIMIGMLSLAILLGNEAKWIYWNNKSKKKHHQNINQVNYQKKVDEYLREEERQRQLKNKRKITVESDSVWYEKVKQLNSRTPYIHCLPDNGCSLYTMQVNTKAKYDTAKFGDALKEYLESNRGHVSTALYQVDVNRNIAKQYYKEFDQLHSVVTNARLKELGIERQEYLLIENDLVQKAKLRFPCEYSIICNVEYTSEQGKRHYTKQYKFYDEQIRMTLEEIDTENRNQAHLSQEEVRRKSERAKVTPSLRYNVMRRDGFKCCLCGRSPKSQENIELEVDHIIPISRGGSTTYSNLQTLCRDCNRGKGAKL